jgi:predicted Zn-dependent protease
MGFMVGSANPFMVMIGMSPLGDKMGQQLGPEFLTVADDPRMAGGLASKPFDAEGTPTKTFNIYEKGVLKSFVHNTSTAKMFETESTGNSTLVGLGEGLKMHSCRTWRRFENATSLQLEYSVRERGPLS